MQFVVSSVPLETARKVRETLRSPQYGHPATVDVARGYGPCRACLRTFVVGEEKRILFTFNPFESGVPAPGPVFVHEEPCTPFRTDSLLTDLRDLPLLFEPLSPDGVPLARVRVDGADVDGFVAEQFERPDVASILVRNAEAGCFIARIERR